MKLGLYIGLIFCVGNVLAQDERIDRKKYLDLSIVVDQNNVPESEKTYYFPIEFFPKYTFSSEPLDSTSFLIGQMIWTFGDDQNRQDTALTFSTALPQTADTLYLEWFSQQLFALKEPLLFNKETDKETFRFTWLRTFDNPITLRIERDGNSIWIYSKVGRGAGGYPPKAIRSNRKKQVSMAEWQAFKLLLEELNYWNSISHGNLPGTDGSHWILEGSTPEKYSVLDKRSPTKGTTFYETCRFLLDLSGVRVRESRIY